MNRAWENGRLSTVSELQLFNAEINIAKNSSSCSLRGEMDGGDGVKECEKGWKRVIIDCDCTRGKKGTQGQVKARNLAAGCNLEARE